MTVDQWAAILGPILGVLLSFCVTVGYYKAKIVDVKDRVLEIEKEDRERDLAWAKHETRLAVVETEFRGLREVAGRLEGKIDSLSAMVMASVTSQQGHQSK